jgi:hypothetical protein
VANEIQVSGKVVLRKGNNAEVLEINPVLNTDQVGQGSFSVTLEIGTAEEDVDLSPVGTEGWAMLRNLDSTNFVNWGPKSAGAMVPLGRLNKNEPAMLRLYPGVTLRMIADTAPCLVKITVLEA